MGIDRRKEQSIYQLAEKENIAPKLIFFDSQSGDMVSEFIQGTPYGKMNGKWLYDKESCIKKIVQSIKKYHQNQAPLLYEKEYPFEIIEHYLEQAKKLSVTMPDNIEEALKIICLIKKILPFHPKVLCHQDLFADNFIYDGENLYLVDWEYAEWSASFLPT